MFAIETLESAEGISALRALIEQHGPLTVAKLATLVWSNPNQPPKPVNRKTLKSYLEMYADDGGWENPRGQTWQMPGQTKKPAQTVLDAPGMAREFNDDEVATKASEVESLQREKKEVADSLKAKQAELEALLISRMHEAKERIRYFFEDSLGRERFVFLEHKPATDEAKFGTPEKLCD
jgi:hypothetical protein